MSDADISGGGMGTSWRNPNCLCTRSGEYNSTLFMYTNKNLVIQIPVSDMHAVDIRPPLAISAALSAV
jgi:hypothetical protein